MDKHGNQHPKTNVAGRIASKNRKEFVKGKWTARLRIHEKAKKYVPSLVILVRKIMSHQSKRKTKL